MSQLLVVARFAYHTVPAEGLTTSDARLVFFCVLTWRTLGLTNPQNLPGRRCLASWDGRSTPD
jgi:hypothetical protein